MPLNNCIPSTITNRTLNKKDIIIGTRGSDLALWQANTVKNQLTQIGLNPRLSIIKTRGDNIQHLGFDKMEGKGFFTKELEEALLSGVIDLAVHSHKDLETNFPEGLTIAAVSSRADARELLLIKPESVDENNVFSLKQGAIVGTSSARRKSQMLHHRPDVILQDLRGNVPTRIEKLRSGNYDAILLAKAGVDRLELDLSGLHAIALPTDRFVPAPAQGVLGIQCRAGDVQLISQLAAIHNAETQQQIHIERTVLNRLQGGCQLPLGVFATKKEDGFHAHVAVAKTWDAPLLKFELEDNSPEKLIENILHRIDLS